MRKIIKKFTIVEIAVFIGLTFIIFYAFSEELTITTYYPSPVGSYKNLTVTGNLCTQRYTATNNINWGNGNVQSLNLSAGANALTFSNGSDGGKYILILRQPSSNATVSWPSSVRWSNGTAPTLSEGGSKTDYIGFLYNGIDSKYDGIAQTLSF